MLVDCKYLMIILLGRRIDVGMSLSLSPKYKSKSYYFYQLVLVDLQRMMSQSALGDNQKNKSFG